MEKHKRTDSSNTATAPLEAPADAEGAITAGGDVVGTTVDNEPLVEGPNSK